MSVTQGNFDSYNTASGAATGTAGVNPEDTQLDEASASGEGTNNLLSGGIGNLTQTASQVVSEMLFR